MNTHSFTLTVQWDKPADTDVSDRDPIRRRHTVSHPNKPDIHGSAATAFHGEVERWNPEELLLAALSQCHMLTFFYLAHRAGLVVTDYTDTPEATLHTHPDGSGNITDVTLRPHVTLATSTATATDVDVDALHRRAHEMCFIARSVNFPVRHDATLSVIT
jgi:organic hydroperoxide reductase OsmC/OhrA